jgi:hypothetical protein
MNLIQLMPGIRREDLLAIAIEEARRQMQAWRRTLDEEWVDLFAWWKQCGGMPFTFASLCDTLPSDNTRLAWGIELLSHGDALFRREGSTWTPLDAPRVLANEGFAHHLKLLEKGTGISVDINGRRGTLTGRSNWRLFEVRWEEGEEAGELARVRGGHIALSS